MLISFQILILTDKIKITSYSFYVVLHSLSLKFHTIQDKTALHCWKLGNVFKVRTETSDEIECWVTEWVLVVSCDQLYDRRGCLDCFAWQVVHIELLIAYALCWTGLLSGT